MTEIGRVDLGRLVAPAVVFLRRSTPDKPVKGPISEGDLRIFDEEIVWKLFRHVNLAPMDPAGFSPDRPALEIRESQRGNGAQ